MYLKKFATITATIFLISSCNMNLVNNTVPEVPSNSKLKGFSIKSTTNPNEIKKNFLPLTRISKSRKKDDEKTKVFNFIATKDDLKRSFLLNIINGAGGLSRVGNIEVSVNGSPIIWGHDEELNETDDVNKIKKEICHDLEHDNDKDDKNKSKNKPSCNILLNNFFNRKTASTSIPLRDLKEGTNTLEIKVKDERNNYALDISIDGFLRSIDIPNAIFSKIPYTPTIRTAPYQKGEVGIKFLEGMKVRLINNPDGTEKLVDLNGTSLTMLENTLKRLKVNLIYRPVSVDPDESDQDEIKAEALLQKDVPNRNLFYNLVFDKTVDVWSIVDELRKIPFLEESFPLFIFPLNSDPFTTEPELLGNIPNTLLADGNKPVIDAYGKHIEKGEWLKKIHVAPHDGKLGAWDITTGNFLVKVATIDTAAQLKINLPDANNHEDFTDINGNLAPNFEPYYNNKELYTDHSDTHGTQVASVIASVPNSKGIAGVAYGCKIMPINVQTSTNLGEMSDTALCLGSQDSNGRHITKPCEQMADSILLARKKGAKVISISMGGIEYGITLEKWSPIVTTEIINAIANGVVVVIAGGNDSPVAGDITREAVEYGTTYYDNDEIYNNIKYFPTQDTGSIIAGGLNWEGNSLAHSINNNKFNFGISPNITNDGIGEYSIGFGEYTYFDKNGNEHGHGTDVSGPAFHIWTAHEPDSSNTRIYDEFGGTSAVAPMTAATAALMLSVNPNLSPLEVRKIIRDTRHDELITNPENKIWGDYPIAGMLDSYEAVYKALCLNPNESERCGNIVNGVFKSIKNSAGNDVPVVTNGSKIEVKSGDQIAIPITPSIKNQLNNVFIGGIQLTLLQIVQNYAIYGVPNLGESSSIATTRLIDIVIKNNLGQTVETLADALKILLDAVNNVRKFPPSITVNGVTTNLDYGYIFSPQSENDYKDYSSNNLAGVKLITKNYYDIPAKWVNDNGSWGVDFSNSPFSAIEVPDGNYEFLKDYTTIALVKLVNDDSINIDSNNGYLFSKWWDGHFNDHSKLNRFSNGYYEVGNTNQGKDPNTGDVYYDYTTDSKVTEKNNTFIISESLDTVSNVKNIVKNQNDSTSTVNYFNSLYTNSISSVTNGAGRMFLGNFLAESDTYGLLWLGSNSPPYYINSNLNLKGVLYGFAIVKQALSNEQIKELHKQMGF